MRVPAVNLNNLNSQIKSNSANHGVTGNNLANGERQISDLKGMPYVYPVNFTAIQNSSKLRILFSYGLPCMYSGIQMIDPKQLSRMLKNQTFFQPSSSVVEILSKYRESFTGIEAKVFDILKDRAVVHPDKNIQELLQEVEPIYRRRLRKKQAPIFRKLTEAAYALPEKYKRPFKKLMDDTDKKLNEKPIIIPFSSYEYKYKLTKIREDIVNKETLKEKKVMNKLIKESKRFANSTNANTIENQKKVLAFQELILRKSVLKNNEQLKNLIELSKSRLNREEVILPFSRKSFLYDLIKVIGDVPNKKLQDKLIAIAQTLPTSQESVSAYVMKVAAETPDKIGHRLMWPSLASIEHILPKSCGGKDALSNFGGATTRENSTRKNIDFVEQLKRRPQARENCQKYIDRLVELYRQGVFYKNGISPKYIVDFKNAIYQQSKHTLNLDIPKI